MSTDGSIIGSLKAVRTLLCDIVAYRTWLGVSTAEAAVARTLLLGEYDVNVTLPAGFLFFSPFDSLPSRAMGGGSSNQFLRTGTCQFLLVQETPEAYAGRDDADWLNAFLPIVVAAGHVQEGVEELAGSGTYINIREFTPSGPVRDKEEQERDLLKLNSRIEWSGPGGLG